jgi:arylsulfatase
LELDDETLVIFTSDNGAAVGSSAPWRGKKATNFEGGVREPCIMRWPGRIPAGSTCNEIAGNIDLLPTLAKLIGVEVDKDRALDGRDITPLMFDPKSGPVRDTHLYFTANQTVAAIRQGDWKLFLANPQGRKNAAPSGPVLYDLARDPGETKDVAAEQADVVAKLKEEAARREAEIKEHRRPAGKLPK